MLEKEKPAYWYYSLALYNTREIYKESHLYKKNDAAYWLGMSQAHSQQLGKHETFSILIPWSYLACAMNITQFYHQFRKTATNTKTQHMETSFLRKNEQIKSCLRLSFVLIHPIMSYIIMQCFSFCFAAISSKKTRGKKHACTSPYPNILSYSK